MFRAGRTRNSSLFAAVTLLAVSATSPDVAFAQRDEFRLEPLVVYANASAESAVVAGPAWRSWLPSHGTHTSTQLTADLTHHRNALMPQRGVQSRVLSTATVRADFDSLVGWSGLTAVVGAASFAGTDQTNALGAANGGTSIDALPFRALGEAWIEQRLGGGAVRLKAGRMDGNTEFAAAANAGAFLRPGSGLDPTLAVVLPTYPLPALGFNAFVQLTSRVRIGGGIYDGRPSARAALGTEDAAPRSRFGIAELEIAGDAGRVAVGAWRHTADFSSLLADAAPTTSSGLSGLYAVVDRTIATFADESSINAFAQLGLADRRLSDVQRHASVGITTPSPFRTRIDDVAGITLSWLALGEAGAVARGSTMGATESHLELLYTAQLTRWLAAVPNLQFIARPVGRVDGRSATAATLRFIVTP